MSDQNTFGAAPTIGAINAPAFVDYATQEGVAIVTGPDFNTAAAAIVDYSQQIGAMFPIVVGDVADPNLEAWVSAVAQSAPGTVGFLDDPNARAVFVEGLPHGVVLLDPSTGIDAILAAIGSPPRQMPAFESVAVQPETVDYWDTAAPEGPYTGPTDDTDYINPDYTMPATAVAADSWDSPVVAQPTVDPAAQPAPADSWDTPVGQIPAPATPDTPARDPWDTPLSALLPESQNPAFEELVTPTAPAWETPAAQNPFPQPFSTPSAHPTDRSPAPDMNANPVEPTGMALPVPAQDSSFNPNAYVPPAAAQPTFAAPVSNDPWNTPVDGHSSPQSYGTPTAPPRVDNTFVQPLTATVHSEVAPVGVFDGHQPHNWKGQVVASFSGKGGVGKTTCTIQLAKRAAQAGLKVIVIDGNVGQGDVLTYLRLNTADMTTIYDIALRIQSGNPQDVMRNGVIQPDAANRARSEADHELDDIDFAIIAAAPSSVEDHRVVTNQLYNAVIDFAARNADLVILDTQILESGDRTNFIGEVILPLLNHGAFGLGVSESGIAGANNLLDRLTKLNNSGIDHRQLMSLFNKISPEGIAAADASAEYFASLATYVGHVPMNSAIAKNMDKGVIEMDDPALDAVMSRILYHVTKDRKFEEAANTFALAGAKPARRRWFSFGRKSK